MPGFDGCLVLSIGSLYSVSIVWISTPGKQWGDVTEPTNQVVLVAIGVVEGDDILDGLMPKSDARPSGQ